ncbi:MAG: riboflavin biosynthesis protein RibD [Deltaproteobacteria bacterium RIFCSPLOWO2_01_44_7]|nr:MAG: riboflavin biosynthesis protein RibD [Deltaproteobacteria bacterium RIFCSPHIGHO2_01_FULL_43_49]OGQ15776.1 MAG: riboflavin biosynthesis protein RibD [Deltaproteobacteria bacterium RIFCSPHIGHO2_02_FULL_44_53]OGQ28732.1 MAG: riboflavin biosynthesis protein RibD [Deltaproteobacteria bacterium RIFCSPHIGHO2_12_FULL_44_21]OGQ32068.1 MAG: riboflavin biosynthesis protein RibD [Deltaproteobacteria bacterium RIFCSPLOWO2_01_FULL_45_74]OGQ38478.1 MAG: riboflavin biosynthesis protein RibD [Deltaprote
MARAIELALKAKGQTSPNPIVGVIITRQGRVLSEGFHRKAGQDHAEIIALKKLEKNEANGSTMYVTMEPCSHHGKTPPCAPRIVEAGIQRVVIGCRDANPQVNGQGIRWLKDAGVEVIEGVMHDACIHLNLPFQKFITTKLPFVTLKVAMSLDGKIATATGESHWISNTLSRQYVHQLRDQVDAILIGAGTLKRDDPLLTVRLPRKKSEKQPLVVIVDASLESPTTRQLFKVKGRQVVLATTQLVSSEKKKIFTDLGAEVLTLPADLTGRVDLRELLRALGKKGVTHLLVEGGSSIFSAFISEKLVDHLVCFLAPKILGGQALDWLPEINIRNLKDALELDNLSVKTLGDNVLIEGELKK